MKRIGFIVLLSLAMSAKAYAQTPHELDLGWDDPEPGASATPVAGYRVYFSDDGPPQAGDARVDVGLVNQFTFPDARLPAPAGDSYFLAVEAYSAAGQVSQERPPIQVIIEFAPPAAPRNVRVLEVRPVEEAPPPAEEEEAPTVFRIQLEGG